MTAEITAGTPKKVGIGLGVGIFLIPIVFAWFLLKDGYSKLSRILAFGWFGLSILITVASPKDSPPTANPNHPNAVANAAAPTPEITAFYLNRKYEANEVSADDAFKGKTYIVVGRISGITKNGFDHIIVELESEKMSAGVYCYMANNLKSQVASLSIGQVIKIRGEITGMGMGHVVVDGQSIN